MKEIQVTLYDILGYAAPGAVALLATVILMWTGFHAGPADLDLVSTHAWIAIALLAYFFGHLVQAVANLFVSYIPTHLELATTGKAPSITPEVLRAVEQKAKELTGIPKDVSIDTKSLHALCDHLHQEQGNTNTRDVYVYREGFYRGMTIASILLSIAFAFRLVCVTSVVKSGGAIYEFSRGQMIVMLALTVFAAYLYFLRYRRFGDYLVRSAVLGTLSLKAKS